MWEKILQPWWYCLIQIRLNESAEDFGLVPDKET